MIKFLKRYNELWLGPIGFIFWILSGWIIVLIDQERAAPYDMAVWQKVIFGQCVFYFCTSSVWFSLRLTFPQVFKYLTEYFDNDFSTLNDQQKCEKLRIGWAVFAVYLLGSVLSMQVL